MTIVILLLVSLLALSAVLYVKIKKLNADDNPYGAFVDQVSSKRSLGSRVFLDSQLTIFSFAFFLRFRTPLPTRSTSQRCKRLG
jgi:hypothetical protein